MLKIEKEMDIFNNLFTQLTITTPPKFKIGDSVFVKRDISDFIDGVDDEYIHVENNETLKLFFGIVIGVINSGDDIGYSYDDDLDQVTCSYPFWDYKILFRNGIFRKDWLPNKVVSEPHIKIKNQGSIDLLSKLDEYVKTCDLNKIQSIKKEKLEKDEILAKRISRIQERYLY